MSKAGDLDELRRTVQTMRELGVTEWNGVKLGAVPAPKVEPPTAKEIEEREMRKRERKRDVRFAASSLRPYLEPKKESR